MAQAGESAENLPATEHWLFLLCSSLNSSCCYTEKPGTWKHVANRDIRVVFAKGREEGDAQQATKQILRYCLHVEKHGEQRHRDKNGDEISTEKRMGQTEQE